MDELRYQHWNLKKSLLEHLNAVAGDREGAALGGLVQHVNRQAHSLERDLEYYSKWEEKEPRRRLWEGSWHKLAALSAEVPEKGRAEGGSDGQKPPTVLQTYTVPLTMVKEDLESWLGPIKAEGKPGGKTGNSQRVGNHGRLSNHGAGTKQVGYHG